MKSDQPKPATGEHECVYSRSMDQPYPRHCIECGKVESTQPKPTDEWTEKSVAMLYANPNHINGWQFIADAHNAAIAAERERHAYSESQRNIMSKMTIAEVEQLREQLAALKETQSKEFTDMQQQLAAERSKVQTLVDALKEIANGDECSGDSLRRYAANEVALAKVKEGKCA